MKTFNYIFFDNTTSSNNEEESPINNYFNDEYLESEEFERFLDTRERVNDIYSEYSRCL